MSLTVMAQFRNESWILNEWIEHYKNEGVTNFILIDNDSTDDWRSKIKKEYLLDKNIVFASLPGDEILRQQKTYNHLFHRLKPKTEWILPIDLDEFIYARKGFKTIVEYLDTLPTDVSQVKVPWKMFGSDGHEKQPPSVIRGFTHYDICISEAGMKRKNADFVLVKSIVRCSDIHTFQLHGHIMKRGKSITPSGRICEAHEPYVPIKDVEDMEDFPLHINHYFTQSLQYFTEIQQTRAGGNNPKNRKDINWFNKNKDRSILDTELADKKYD